MNEDGTYADHITLQAASSIFSVQITVHSSLGVEENTMIFPFTKPVESGELKFGLQKKGLLPGEKACSTGLIENNATVAAVSELAKGSAFETVTATTPTVTTSFID